MSKRRKAPDIRLLFEPRSVAVIGASDNRDKIGYKIVENIVAGGYRGDIIPVNPKGGRVLGKRMLKSIREARRSVDVALIAIPAGFVLESVKECAAAGVKFIPIISSGFSEIGNLSGEREIVDFAAASGMRVLGPNIFGVFSARARLNATFGPKGIRSGNVAIITQSGALGIAMIGKTAMENMGLSAMISVGNKSDLAESDLLDYLVSQKETKAILLYVEGFQNGEKTIAALKAAAAKKPVVMIKSGRSKRGAIAAASHTGALAGSDEILNDIARQCGVIRAESLEEAFHWCRFLSTAPAPKSENAVIITNGGGIGVMATDACEKYGVQLYDDTGILRKTFSHVTPDFGSTKNPVDLTGQARSEDYTSALEAALKKRKIGSVMALYCETAVFDSENLAAMIRKNAARYARAGKPLIFSVFGGDAVGKAALSLKKDQAPVFEDIYDAVSSLGALYSHYRRASAPAQRPEDAPIDAAAVSIILDRARNEGRSFLLAHEARELMNMIGLPVPRSTLARSLEEAVRGAEEIGFPVAVKIVSRDILHKSDAGGVMLDLNGTSEVIDAYEAILHNCRRYNPRAAIEGVEVAEMVKQGTETIIGARRDRSFGPIVMCGMGGVYVEVMKDVSFRSVPADRGEILSMIKKTKIYPLLLGVRGENPKHIEGVIQTIIKLGSLVRKCRGISDIEVNPLVVYDEGEGTKAVDVRVLLSERQETK